VAALDRDCSLQGRQEAWALRAALGAALWSCSLIVEGLRADGEVGFRIVVAA
jgi:hypothetical protein